jgi:hypothetical protein
MNLCRHCKWSEPCICVICEDGTTLVCSIKHKHVEKDDSCDLFEEDENKEEKGYYKNGNR